jgi:hypothetical protein
MSFLFLFVDERLVTHALKPITEGEVISLCVYGFALANTAKTQEILTVYFNTRQPRHARQKYLKDNYHFECSCTACSMSSTEIKESDKMLEEINKLYERFRSWQDGVIDGAEAAKTANGIWELENVEGYWSELVSVFPRFPFLSLY